MYNMLEIVQHNKITTVINLRHVIRYVISFILKILDNINYASSTIRICS